MHSKHLLWCVAPVFALAAAAHAAAPEKQAVAAYAARVLAATCTAAGPGTVVLVARGDEVLFRDACGRASLELDVPLTPDHVLRLASITKQFAAAGVLKLVDDGKVALDDPVSKFVPGYPNGDAITVGMLLDHTSGIRSYTSIPEIMSGGGILKDVSTAQLIDSFKDVAPDFAPGADYRYNNSAYVLVGAVIEAASGQSWDGYLREVFFAPLGMAHTRGGNATAHATIPGVVAGYTSRDGTWAPAQYISMSQPHAAGALVSSVDDLLTWNRALHEGKLLSERSYRAMVTPTGKAAGSRYGFGIVADTFRGEPMLQHGGGIFGFNTYLLYMPGPDISVAVLQNTDDTRGAPGAETAARMLAAMVVGKPYPEKTPIPVDAATLRQYAGVYRIDAETTHVLRVDDGRLRVQRLPGGQSLALIPVATDVFLFDEGLSRIVFERDVAGAVVAMRFFAEDEGEGEVAPRTDEAPPSARAQMHLPDEARSRVIGTYAHEAMVVNVFLQDDTLMAQLSGQAAIEIFAESPTRFYPKTVDATLVFSPEHDAAETLTLLQGDTTLVFERQQRD